MANYLSNMPLWAVILFIISFLFSIAFIAVFAKRAALNAGMALQQSRNIQNGVFIFYLIYLAYVTVLALTGALEANTIPPKVVILASLPLTLFLFGYIGNTKLFKRLLEAITLESLITVHVFRLVGIFFILLYYYHMFPWEFAISGEMGDIITALLAIPVARLISKGRNRWRLAAVYAWNIFGILDVVRLLFMATVIAKTTAATGIDGGLREITVFPFVWFPTFAPATILFLHTMVFWKLSQQSRIAKNLPTTSK